MVDPSWCPPNRFSHMHQTNFQSDESLPIVVDALLSTKLSRNTPNHGGYSPLIQLNADAIADAHMGVIPNGSIVLKRTALGFEIVASGTQHQIEAQGFAESTMQITLANRILIPALVNAHTHLDLTHIGPVAHNPSDGFVQWVDMIRSKRKSEDQEIRSATRFGIACSLAGGCAAVGDIAGAPGGRLTDAPAIELAHSPLYGVSYLEFFGIGKSKHGAIDRVKAYLNDHYPNALDQIKERGVQIGFQPHAPNTVDLEVYQWIVERSSKLGFPVSTHLAETPEEREFIAHATGPQRELLERLGVWDDSVLEHIGRGKHPVAHLKEVLDGSSMLVAHINDATDDAIEILAQTKTHVAYCPRGSMYFGADRHFGAHRYKDMLDAGVRVCLGTDSIVNLDTHDRISVLDEMRLLHLRDAIDPRSLIAMGTIHGASALGLDQRAFTLAKGSQPMGLIAVPLEPAAAELCASQPAAPGDIWDRAMRSTAAPEWVFLQEKPS